MKAAENTGRGGDANAGHVETRGLSNLRFLLQRAGRISARAAFLVRPRHPSTLHGIHAAGLRRRTAVSVPLLSPQVTSFPQNSRVCSASLLRGTLN